MNIDTRKYSAVLLGLLLSACGSGGGGDTQLAGIDRLGVSTGTVTGFGSVFVNGTQYDTDSAQFTVDDAPGTQDDLEIGDIAIITFDPDVSSTVAITVTAEDTLAGIVESIDLVAERLQVAGQTVVVDAATVFASNVPGTSLTGLLVGDAVRISGLTTSSGDVRATRVERATAQVRVEGEVANLDTVARTFEVNQLVVDYGSVPATLEGFPTGQPSNGDFVEVRGAAVTNGVLPATLVEPEELADDVDFDDFDEIDVEIEGLITRFVSATDFDVDGLPVTTTASTDFEGGTAGELAEDVRVEIEGELRSDGTLVADDVEFRRDIDSLVAGRVDIVAGDSLTMLGITIRVDSLTKIIDQSDAEDDNLTLAEINVGDFVVAAGAADGMGLLATLLEREDQPDPEDGDALLGGEIQSIAEPVVQVFGVSITVDDNTEIDGELGELTPEEFFLAIAIGDAVEVSGQEIGDSSILASRIEVQGPDEEDD